MSNSKLNLFFGFLECFGLASLCLWFFGLFHGPDAKHVFLFFFLLSGGLQYFAFKRVPESWLWKRFFAVLQNLENSSRLRNLVFLSAVSISTVLFIMKTFAGRYMMFDQGIFNQIMWSIGNGLGFHTTIEAPGNHFLVHLSPTLFFAWPISALFHHHPVGLVLVSSLCVWGGLYAWLMITRIHPLLENALRSKIETGVLLLVLFFDSTWTNLSWGFHESHLAFLFLSWGYYFFLKNRSWISLLLFAFTALSKEQYLLDMAFLGFALALIDRKSKWRYLAFSAFVLSVFGFYRQWNRSQLLLIESSLPEGYLLDFFKHYFDYLGVAGVGDLIKKAITDPVGLFRLWIENRLQDGSWFFPLGLGLTFGFGFLVKQGKTALLSLAMLPGFLIIYLAKEAKLQDHGFQYVMILWPTLFVLSLPGFAITRFRVTAFHLYIAVIVCFWSGGIDYWKTFRSTIRDAYLQKELLIKVSEIDPEESVWSDRLISTMANRRVVQSPPFVHYFKDRCPDWVIGSESETVLWLNDLKSKCSAEYLNAWSTSGTVGYHRVK